MTNRRFIISSRSIRDGYASFDGELFNHIVRVLRLGQSDLLTLVDENGCEYSGKIDQVAKEWVAVKIISTRAPEISDQEATKITICQALPKGDKIDLILQKGTELGAHDFWLFGGRRSVSRLREDQCDSKLERWNRITSEAARQSGRRTIPLVRWFPTAVEAADASYQDLRLLLWEGEREQKIKTLLNATARPASVIASIGPEGGFDPLEVRHFSRHGFQPATLGTRILRTETVAIAITAILQYIWDEI